MWVIFEITAWGGNALEGAFFLHSGALLHLSQIQTSAHRNHLEMIIDRSNGAGRDREIGFLCPPMLMKQCDGFTCGIEHELFREHGFGREVRELVL